MRMTKLGVVLGATLVLAAGAAQAGVVRSGDDMVPTGKGWGVQAPNAPKALNKRRPGGSGISYHGGPVMVAGPNVYLIWYGNWNSTGSNSATSVTLMDALASNIGGSSYFNINTTYYNGSGTHVANKVTHVGDYTDSYSQGSSLSDSQIQAIVAAKNPTDTNGIYFVLTSSDVNETSGFCTKYCGWHTHATINGQDIKYAFVGNPDRCPSACEAQTTSPNNDSGADGMASIFAHELEEATTDPDLNAWYSSTGSENGDLCAWTFGTESTAANGSKYNMVIGGYEWLIQQNYIATNGPCALSY